MIPENCRRTPSKDYHLGIGNRGGVRREPRLQREARMSCGVARIVCLRAVYRIDRAEIGALRCAPPPPIQIPEFHDASPVISIAAACAASASKAR